MECIDKTHQPIMSHISTTHILQAMPKHYQINQQCFRQIKCYVPLFFQLLLYYFSQFTF